MPRRLTRKKFIKLLMAMHVQRNTAEEIADAYNAQGKSYNAALRHLVTEVVPRAVAALVERIAKGAE